MLKGEISTFVLFSSDRLFLYVFATPAIVGLYEAAYRVIQPFYAIAAVINDAMFLRLSSWLKDQSAPAFARYVDRMSVLTIPLGFFCLGHAPLVVDIAYGAEFAEAGRYLAILGWVITFGYTAGTLVIPFVPWGQSRQYGNAIFGGSIATLALNTALIPPLGGYGAAIATVVAKVVVTAIGLRHFRLLTRYPILRHFGQYLVVSASALITSQIAMWAFRVPAVWGAATFAVSYLALLALTRGLLTPSRPKGPSFARL